MKNPGSFSLGDFNIGGPAMQIGAVVADLPGMASLTLQARFMAGANGTSCKAYVQTSFDQGQTWCDVACFAFAAVNGVQVVNLTTDVTVSPPVAPTDGSLADDTVLSGPLGDQLRAKVVSTGIYINSTLLSLWAVAR